MVHCIKSAGVENNQNGSAANMLHFSPTHRSSYAPTKNFLITLDVVCESATWDRWQMRVWPSKSIETQRVIALPFPLVCCDSHTMFVGNNPWIPSATEGFQVPYRNIAWFLFHRNSPLLFVLLRWWGYFGLVGVYRKFRRHILLLLRSKLSLEVIDLMFNSDAYDYS